MPTCDFSKVASNFIEITLWHGCIPVNLMHVFRILVLKNTFPWLLHEDILNKADCINRLVCHTSSESNQENKTKIANRILHDLTHHTEKVSQWE